MGKLADYDPLVLGVMLMFFIFLFWIGFFGIGETLAGILKSMEVMLMWDDKYFVYIFFITVIFAIQLHSIRYPDILPPPQTPHKNPHPSSPSHLF